MMTDITIKYLAVTFVLVILAVLCTLLECREGNGKKK